MMGSEIPDKELVVSANLNCVLAQDVCDKEEVNVCIRCGKCTDVCPAQLSPVLIRDNIDKPNNLRKLKVKRCMECGLCSYICPSKIKLREIVIQSKEKIKEGEYLFSFDPSENSHIEGEYLFSFDPSQ